MTDSALPPLVVVAGVTASGKTALSLALAEALAAHGIPAEIVSADSRQVYRGMDIGTAKATPEERARVPHHGLDLVDPDQPFSVADYSVYASAALAGIAERGAVAILAGGTGFYLRAVARGLETVIESQAAASPIAWFPAALSHITTHPSGRTWADAVSNHLYLLTLEGG